MYARVVPCAYVYVYFIDAIMCLPAGLKSASKNACRECGGQGQSGVYANVSAWHRRVAAV